jgi:hypothetical protein
VDQSPHHVQAHPVDRNGAPMPVPTGGPSMHDLVIEDLAARKQFGLERYGSVLQAHNGRDALQDLYEEMMDALVYLRQLMAERDSITETAECAQREAQYSRLRRHLVDQHGYQPADCMQTATSHIQEHLDAHRLLKKDHDYHPWGEQ